MHSVALSPRLDACAAITSSVMMSMSRCRSWGFSTSVSSEGVFEPPNLQQATDIARLAHRRSQPDVDDPDGRVEAVQQRRPSVMHVRAVVLARVPGDRLVRTHRRADAADLVRGNRRADAGAVDDDPGVGLRLATLRATAPAMSG